MEKTVGRPVGKFQRRWTDQATKDNETIRETRQMNTPGMECLSAAPRKLDLEMGDDDDPHTHGA